MLARILSRPSSRTGRNSERRHLLIPPTAESDDNADKISELIVRFEDLQRRDLRDLCCMLGLPTSGTKKDLLERIMQKREHLKLSPSPTARARTSC